METEESIMEKAIMKKDFAKAFKRTVLLAILLAVFAFLIVRDNPRREKSLSTK